MMGTNLTGNLKPFFLRGFYNKDFFFSGHVTNVNWPVLQTTHQNDGRGSLTFRMYADWGSFGPVR